MIWIFIPVFNEDKAIKNLLLSIKNNLCGLDFKIVVIDDGSRDRTNEILFGLIEKLPLKILTHLVNRGLGETERNGFEYIAWHASSNDILVRVEGDGTHEPKYIHNLINRIEQGYDVVNTSRFQKGGNQLGVNLYRRIISRCANIFVKIIFGVKNIKDYSCGFRAYRIRIIQDAICLFGSEFMQLRGLGFTSTLEIIVKLNLIKCRFSEIPFILRYDKKRGKSKMVSSVTSLGYLTMAVLYYWPFDGWKKKYKKIGENYQKNNKKAVSDFKKQENFPIKIY